MLGPHVGRPSRLGARKCFRPRSNARFVASRRPHGNGDWWACVCLVLAALKQLSFRESIRAVFLSHYPRHWFRVEAPGE